MKSLTLNILLLLTASNVGLIAQTTSDPPAFVIERDLVPPDVGTGMTHMHPLESLGGSFTPAMPISEHGSSFDLYAWGTAWDDTLYHLDTKLVKAYSPAAAFTIDTGDPYIRGDVANNRYVKRMRADKTYMMKIDVSGLIPGSTNRAEREVRFVINGINYDRVTYSGLGKPEEELFALDIVGNITFGPYSFNHDLTEPAQKEYACGEMKFRMWRWAADGVDDTIIAEPKIEIWPVSTARVENIAENQVFIDKIPLVIFHYKDLYPDSRTYVQIYSGKPPADGSIGQGTVVETTERKMGKFYNPDLTEEPTTVPMTMAVGVEGLSNYTATDGIYTVEVITQSPYSRTGESLGTVTFEVDRIISSRGKLSTAEGAANP